jgi:ribosomal protein L11 methyltransferase
MSDKIWYAVEVEIARVGETAASAQLWAFNTTGVEISEDANNPDFITLRAYFNSAPDAEKLRGQILRNLRLIDLPEFALRGIRSLTVADQDWLAEWKKGYEPIAIGRSLLVCPSWRLDQARNTDRLVIEIDPGMAFGTGTHETTRGCLEMLEKYWEGGSLLRRNGDRHSGHRGDQAPARIARRRLRRRSRSRRGGGGERRHQRRGGRD